MPRAAGSGRHYGVGIIGVQDPECPCCGKVHGHLEGMGTPVTIQDQFPSVTTIIGGTLPKDGLVGWAANIAIEGMLDLAQEKGWDLTDPTMDKDKAKGLLEGFGFTSYGVRDEKADVGTNVHDVLEGAGKAYLAAYAEEPSHPKGDEAALAKAHELVDALPEGDEQGYGQAVLAWLIDRSPQPILVEHPIYCHHHETAGTLDLCWRVTRDQTYQRLTPKRRQVSWEIDFQVDQVVVTDLKTSKSFYDSHFIQASWFGGHMVPEHLRLAVDKATVLKVAPDGSYEEKEADCGPDYFASLRQVYRHKKGE